MSLLQMSFSGAVLIAVIAVIRAVAIHKLPKKTFLILWGIVLFRLLIPYTVPSAFSVYTLVSPQTPASVNTIYAGNQYEKATVNGNFVAIEDTLREQKFGLQKMPENQISPATIGLMVWLIGMTLCSIFFTISYLHWRFEFQAALPIQNDFVEQWQKTHWAKRPVLVRQSDKVSAPLSYGIWKSVILMPKKTDWNNTGQLEYILLHEYVHICRHDSAVKLISAFALCVHWFNPFVWVMYFLLQRDIELACDESVVRRFGEQSKSIYANMLIDMEARKSGLMPLCNNFSKNAIEERIIAVMKMKKTSVMAVLLSAALIVGVAAAFATSASAKKAENTETAFSDEEYDKLLALQFDGYEDLSVSEYQKRVWEMTDTTEYLELLERFSQDTAFYEMKDTDEAASFLFYTLEPLTAEKWQTREFGGYCKIGNDGVSDNASLEYSITLDIQNADALTVREYNNTCVGMINGLQNLLQDKTVEQLQNEAVMQKMLHAEIEALKGQWSSENLKVDVEYFYIPLSEIAAQSSTAQSSDAQNGQEEQETRQYSNGTEEDYRSLLTLKTPDYKKMTVADFNRTLLDWANENYERMERIYVDTAYQDFAVSLTDEEMEFVTVSVQFSGMENGAYVRSSYTGKPEVDPGYGRYLPEKAKQQDGRHAWCDLYYQFSYHIADKNAITVEERDRCVSGMMSGIQDFWNKAALEDLLGMTEEEVVKELEKIAEEHSDDKITVAISGDQVSFDCMDEIDNEGEEENRTGVINSDVLKLRAEASGDAPVTTLLPETLEVIILSEEKGFYHIIVPSAGDLEGWVRKEYVDVD